MASATGRLPHLLPPRPPSSVARLAGDGSLQDVDLTNFENAAAEEKQQPRAEGRRVSVSSLSEGDQASKETRGHEQPMTFKYAMCNYRPAMMWAIAMTAPIIMEGYETAVVPSFFSYQPFCRHYGNEKKPSHSPSLDSRPSIFDDLDRDGFRDWVIDPDWQVGITIAMEAGQLVGLLLAPVIASKIGYPFSYLAGLLIAASFLVISFYSTYVQSNMTALGVFLAGEALLGIPWGLFQGLILPYVVDITPLELRPAATTMISVFCLIGQFISTTVLRFSGKLGDANDPLGDPWAVRVPILVQYIWLPPLMFLALLAPESPLHLMSKEYNDEAVRTLQRLTKDRRYDAHGSLATMRLDIACEKSNSHGMGFRACFNKENRKRTEIAIIVYLTQQLVGSPLISYSAKLVQTTGVSQRNSLSINMCMYAGCISATFVSMVVIRKIARRTMWLSGLTFAFFCLVAVGIGGFFINPTTIRHMGWVVSAFLFLYAVCCNLTLGPLAYAIVSEVPSACLKAPTNSIARGMYVCLTILNLYFVPCLLDDRPRGWGLGPKAALVWAGCTLGCFVWAYFRLPEMKDRTLTEVDMMFAKRIPARKWTTTRV